MFIAMLQTGCATLEPRETTYRLYFLGGQSNMNGYGFSTDLPENMSQPSPNVMIFVGQTALDNETRGGYPVTFFGLI